MRYSGKKVEAAALKLAAKAYGSDIIMDAALELEWLRNKVGQQRNTIKKKQHVIDTVNHHNNRLSNDSRAAHYALGHKFMEVDKLKKAMIEIQRIVWYPDNIDLGREITAIDKIVNDVLEELK